MAKDRVTLAFPAGIINEPITYVLIKKYDLIINIIKAEITMGKEGHLLLELEGEQHNLDASYEYLKEVGIHVIPLKRQIRTNEEQCVNCGACTAVCFSEALTMNRETWKLGFDSEKCIVCGLCIQACPVSAIQVNFGEEI